MSVLTTAMILAAGRGERMRPLTDATPKPLLQVRRKPLIQYHIEALASAGVTQIVINHAWLGEQIEKYIGDGERFGVKVTYSAEEEALETAGGLRHALPLLLENNPLRQVIVVNGDVFTEFDYTQLPLLEGNDSAHLVLVPNPPQHPDGDFSLADDRVLSTGEQCHTFSGIAVYALDAIAAISPGRAALAPLLRAWMQKGNVSGCLYTGVWHDIGTPERLSQINSSGPKS